MKRDPIFEISASWESPHAAEDVLEAIGKVFFAEDLSVDVSTGSVEVRSGSNFWYRMMGEMLNSYKNAPVALMLSVRPSDDGSIVDARAFETYGSRATDKTMFGAARTFKLKLVDLMETASSAVRPRNPGWS